MCVCVKNGFRGIPPPQKLKKYSILIASAHIFTSKEQSNQVS